MWENDASPMVDGPTLSVLVICRNYERYVAECLRSILAADQSCQLVFADNGSRDASVEVARATLAKAPSHVSTKLVPLTPELPLCRALNVAHRECTGDFVKLISADDMLGPNFFEAFRRLVATSAGDIGVWLAGSVVIDDAGNVLRQAYSPARFGSPDDGSPYFFDERDVLDYRHAPPHSTASVFYRRQVYREVGGFDERFRYEDKPFYFNALKRGWKIAVHPYNNTYYRVHGAGISANSTWMAEARLPVMLDQTLRAEWRNKPLALRRLASNVRVVAMNRWRSWRARVESR